MRVALAVMFLAGCVPGWVTDFSQECAERGGDLHVHQFTENRTWSLVCAGGEWP